MAPLPDPQCSYSQSFLNQLQSEWNEFWFEIGQEAASDIIKAGGFRNSTETKNIFREKLIESLNKFNCTVEGNIIVPVPLTALKRLFSPTKCTSNDFKAEFFDEMRENLNLTNVTCKKLQKLLLSESQISESSHEVSDFPSPSVAEDPRKSAPPRLLHRKPVSKPKNDIFRAHKVNIDNDQGDQLRRGVQTPPPVKGGNALQKIVNNILFDDSRDNDKKLIGSNQKARLKKTKKENASQPAASGTAAIQRYSNVYNGKAKAYRESSSLFLPEKSHKKFAKPTIVCTYFTQEELVKIYQAVKKLGFFEIENNVSSRTTHVVCGSSKKTVNLCKAVVRGCWILEKDWVLLSFQEGRWLYEERFEMSDLSPAVKENRLKHQIYGPMYQCELFKGFGSIYVSKNCAHPKANDIKELVNLSGGQVTDKVEKSKCVIGYLPDRDCYKETWILNCIMQGRVIELSERFKIA